MVCLGIGSEQVLERLGCGEMSGWGYLEGGGNLLLVVAVSEVVTLVLSRVIIEL